MILTKSGAKEYLRNLKPFQSAYDNLDAQNQVFEDQYTQNVNSIYDASRQATHNLGLQYGQDRYNIGNEFANGIAEISANAAKSRANLLSASGTMGAGSRAAVASDLERAMSSAYDAYAKNRAMSIQDLNQNLASNKATIESNTQSAIQSAQSTLLSQQSQLDKAKSDIDKSLEAESERYSNLYNAPREYLNYLVSKKLIDETNPDFAKYYDMTYVNGTPTYNLRGDDWFERNFYERDENGNPTGMLSDVGKDFYSQMLYGTGNIPNALSFEAWLRDKDSDLWEWASSAGYDEKYSRNLDAVFGNAGVDVNNHNYQYKDLDVYNPKVNDKFVADYETEGKGGLSYDPATTTYEPVDKNLGRVSSYKGNETINVFTTGKITGLNKKHVGTSSENFTFRSPDSKFTLGGAKSSFTFNVDKNSEKASDDIINDLYKTVGKIEDNTLYTYGKTIYVSKVDEDGTVALYPAKLTSKKETEQFWRMIKNDPHTYSNIKGH